MKFNPETLRSLKEKDAVIQEIMAMMADIPRRKRDREIIIETAKENISECESRVKEMQKLGDTSDLDLKDIEERMEKLLVQRNLAKSNAEMAAFNHQIALLNEKKSELETAVLKSMEEVDKSKGDLERAQHELGISEKEYADFAAEMDEKHEKLNEKLQVEENGKKELLDALEPEVVQMYERILSHTGDSAIAELENGTCLGCEMSLPPNVINNVMACNDIVRCQNCQRILILSKDEASKYC